MRLFHVIVRILIILSPFYVPWWAVLLFVLAALSFYSSYYDVLVIAFIADVLYGSEHTFFGLYGFVLIGCVLLAITHQIKKRLIMY